MGLLFEFKQFVCIAPLTHSLGVISGFGFRMWLAIELTPSFGPSYFGTEQLRHEWAVLALGGGLLTRGASIAN